MVAAVGTPTALVRVLCPVIYRRWPAPPRFDQFLDSFLNTALDRLRRRLWSTLGSQQGHLSDHYDEKRFFAVSRL